MMVAVQHSGPFRNRPHEDPEDPEDPEPFIAPTFMSLDSDV
jgi:hypothetical protein